MSKQLALLNGWYILLLRVVRFLSLLSLSSLLSFVVVFVMFVVIVVVVVLCSKDFFFFPKKNEWERLVDFWVVLLVFCDVFVRFPIFFHPRHFVSMIENLWNDSIHVAPETHQLLQRQNEENKSSKISFFCPLYVYFSL